MKKDDNTFLIDQSIPYAEMLYAGLGAVEFFDSSAGGIPVALLARADVLAVTSSVRVDNALLAGCRRLKVLATPVVGTDHVDSGAVTAAGERLGHPIAVVNAPGSTAQAVADWTVGAMFAALGRMPASIAIVGFGNCGRAVAERLSMLRIPFVTCDPLLAGIDPGFPHTPVDRLDDVEVATFHVPLTFPGQSPFPTSGMIDAAFAHRFEAAGGRLVVNSSRGGILDESLSNAPRSNLNFALDVFAGEPTPSRETVAAAAIATPHIAGSGRFGRFNAARMVRSGTCRILGLDDEGIQMPAELAASRPTLEVQTGSPEVRASFTKRLVELSGAGISVTFRDAWKTTADADLPGLFRRVRLSGLRTEPIWTPSPRGRAD